MAAHDQTAKLVLEKNTTVAITDLSWWTDTPITGNVTIDLAGHEISVTADARGWHFLILSSGTLTMKDSGETGKITMNQATILYVEGGTLNVEAGTYVEDGIINDNNSCVKVQGGSTVVNISGGTFQCDAAQALNVFNASASETQLSGGTYISKNGNAIRTNTYYNGYFLPGFLAEGYVYKKAGIVQNYTGAYVTGSGTVTVEQSFYPFTITNSYEEVGGAPVNVVTATPKESVSLTVTDVTLTDTTDGEKVYTTDSNSLRNIPEGIYNVAVTASDGQTYPLPQTYTVKDAVAKIDGAGYYSLLKEAFAAAQELNSAHITVQKDVFSGEILMKKGNITLTVPAGKTINSETGEAAIKISGGNLTLDGPGNIRRNDSILFKLTGPGSLHVTAGNYWARVCAIRVVNPGAKLQLRGGVFGVSVDTVGAAIYNETRKNIGNFLAEGYCLVGGENIDDRGHFFL